MRETRETKDERVGKSLIVACYGSKIEIMKVCELFFKHARQSLFVPYLTNNIKEKGSYKLWLSSLHNNVTVSSNSNKRLQILNSISCFLCSHDYYLSRYALSNASASYRYWMKAPSLYLSFHRYALPFII